ncbi:hypothetical protein AGRHK599_LOCUS4394 [Rhizobium rhizogenes]|uniref:Cysteine rich repeat-containing protein n=2 Tax=Rhizobium rhizogenes TaxID=359 RepID=A0AAN2A799_RHIRH|nr:hypothetical protein B0909_16185 [Rhizobium rhizogenes]CAD0216131.1 hypothetical protein AGRHK599_LOCUS4394 [Rhizobium rhizogenes]
MTGSILPAAVRMAATGFLMVYMSLPAQPALAQSNPDLRKTCEADHHRLCSAIAPGGGRILQCLAAREKELTEECAAVIRRYKSQYRD